MKYYTCKCTLPESTRHRVLREHLCLWRSDPRRRDEPHPDEPPLGQARRPLLPLGRVEGDQPDLRTEHQGRRQGGVPEGSRHW